MYIKLLFQIWDTHNQSCTKTIEPSKLKELKRPMLGKWVGCVASDQTSEWITMGGGPAPSLWHIRSESMALPLEVHKCYLLDVSSYISCQIFDFAKLKYLQFNSFYKKYI